jgi:hypothetical protein
MTTPFQGLELEDISADHAQLLAQNFSGTERQEAFWSLPLPSSPPRRLGDLVGYPGRGRRVVLNSRLVRDPICTWQKRTGPTLIKSLLLTLDPSAISASLPTDPGFVSRPEKIIRHLSGKFGSTAPTFIPYCQVGTIRPRNVADIGLPMAATTTSSAILTWAVIFG